jgi:hypothetical protein
MRFPSLQAETFTRATFGALIVMTIVCALTACAMPNGQYPSTAAEIKEFIQQPLPLLILMLLAALGSAWKQMWVAVKGDAERKVTPYTYFVRNWPETLISLGVTIGLWLTLIVTDSLNWAAIGFGYIANDTADIFTKRGRSELVATGTQPPKPE